MSVWPATVGRYKDGTGAKSSVLNAPIERLDKRTEWLRDRFDVIEAGMSLRARVPANGMVAHAVVSMDAHGNLVPASAAWSGTRGPNGELEPALEAYPFGIVLAVESAVAEVLISGTVPSADVGISDTGVLWLSQCGDGVLTTTRPGMGVRCGVSVGGLFTFTPAVPLGDAHTHARLTMSSGWLPFDDPAFAAMDVPEGAVLGYDVITDPCSAEVLSAPEGDAVCFVEGLFEPLLVVASGNIWWTGDVGEAPAEFEAFLLMPVSYDTPIVRGVASSSTELLVSAKAGVVTIGIAPWTEEGGPYGDCDDPRTYDTLSRWCVASVDGRTYRRTANISQLVPGPGIGVVTDSRGRALVAAQAPEGIHVVDAGVQKLVFPASRVSSVVGRIHVPSFGEVDLESRVFVDVFMKGGVSTPAFSVSVKGVPDVSTGPADIAGPFTTTIASVSGTVNKVVRGLAVGQLYLPSGGTLFVSIEVDAGASDVEVIGFGVVMEASEASP